MRRHAGSSVNGAGPDVMNSFDYPDAVRVREQRIDVGGSNLEYVFPAHSITVMQMEVACASRQAPPFTPTSQTFDPISWTCGPLWVTVACTRNIPRPFGRGERSAHEFSH